ncbi:MAG: acetyl-CoA C-acyltransferase, partial [Crocinitomicaceae bacterium]|nr:acetyl-CoA C-acyltransferase [Crocinitomicaceae bacterium]
MKTAYIVKGYRTAVGKAKKGGFRFSRPDDLAADVIKHLVSQIPNLDKNLIDDVIVGNAMPEAEQGLNVARLISIMGLDTDKVPGMTVNRYCSSGLETMAIATAKIQAGMANMIIAGGAESMSAIEMGGWRVVPNPKVSKAHPDYYWGMGTTAEAVATQYKVSREDQDQFSLNSHLKAIKAQAEGRFNDDIVPINVSEVYLDASGKRAEKINVVKQDEGPRKETT